MKKKICYVLPEYSENDHTHFAHIQDFLVEISKSADIFLLIEKADISKSVSQKIKEELGVKEIYIQGRSNIFGWVKNLIGLLKARWLGYKDFYIHYSFLSAFNAYFVTGIFGGRVFYWNCGLPWKYKRNFLRLFFEKVVYKSISFLVTGTESLALAYSKAYSISPQKIKVMPNWISLERFQVSEGKVELLKKELGISGKEKILLFAHRLSRRKGAHLLPDIFRNIKNLEVKLIIIGDGPDYKFLESKFMPEIKNNRVRLLGWVPNKDIGNYYGLADVFLMPSEEEGFPRVLLETMAIGVPFIAFNVGGVKEIIPEYFSGNVLPKEDVNAFADLVDKIILEDREYFEKWKKISKEWVQRFKTKEVAGKFLELFPDKS
jgi:glycosyltransferase involved in cell wall biosynthesis